MLGTKHDLVLELPLKALVFPDTEKKGVAMRLDGEPWWQPLPDTEGDNVTVRSSFA